MCRISQESGDGAATRCCCGVRPTLVCASLQHGWLHRQDQGEPENLGKVCAGDEWVTVKLIFVISHAKYFIIEANVCLDGIAENKTDPEIIRDSWNVYFCINISWLLHFSCLMTSSLHWYRTDLSSDITLTELVYKSRCLFGGELWRLGMFLTWKETWLCFEILCRVKVQI